MLHESVKKMMMKTRQRYGEENCLKCEILPQCFHFSFHSYDSTLVTAVRALSSPVTTTLDLYLSLTSPFLPLPATIHLAIHSCRRRASLQVVFC